MALPKEPRQKMINIMYLVLTALLALNISSEILNAFKTVDSSLMIANATIETKNADIFKSFQKKLEDPASADRAKQWLPLAEQAKRYADQVYNQLDAMKQQLKKEAGLTIEGGVEKYAEDNLDAATRMMVEHKEGDKLKKALEDFKKNLLSIHPEIKSTFEKALPISTEINRSLVQNSANRDFSSVYFRMTPTIAAITILSKFQNDIRNSEAMVVDFCHRKVGEVEIVYDEFKALAGTNSQYLMPGQELVITAGVGAFSKKAQPTVNVDGSPVSLNAEGVAEFKTNVGGPGTYTKNVKITFIKPDGTPSTVEKKIEYTVGSPTGATVSAEKVKVLYIDLPNELAVSGGTVGDERVKVSIDNGSLNKTAAGRYIASPSRVGEATVTVNADGKVTPFKFRVKNVPPPIGMIGASEGGRIPVNQLKAQAGVRAELKDFIFEGVKFDIVGYTVYATGAGFTVPGISPNGGAYFNEESKRIISRLQPGSTLIIDEIRAVGPGGTRKLPPMAFNCY